MNKKIYKKSGSLFIAVVLLALASAKVQAQTMQEESYEDLVKRLNQRRAQVSAATISQNEANPLDDLTIHTGFGLITSTFNVRENGDNSQFNLQGFQLSAGIDLFSPNYVAEAAVRNFGQQTQSVETDSFREIDLKAMYRQPSRPNDLGYRFGTGIATRYLSVSRPGFSSDETNPAMILFGGLEASFSRSFGLGVELGYRRVLASNTTDQNSMDLTIRLDGFF